MGTDVYSDASRNLWRAKILFDVEPSTFARHVDHHHVDVTQEEEYNEINTVDIHRADRRSNSTRYLFDRVGMDLQ